MPGIVEHDLRDGQVARASAAYNGLSERVIDTKEMCITGTTGQFIKAGGTVSSAYPRRKRNEAKRR